MDLLINIILFIISLGLLVTIHELGHFSMAKLFKVYCREFSVGFGPLLLKKKWGETQYSLRAIPLGGYVSMVGEGEDENQDEEDEEIKNLPKERSLLGIAKWKRAIIMVAGVTLNMVLAFLFFIGYFATTEQIDTSYRSFRVLENGTAYNQGLREDDEIIKLDYLGTIDGKTVEYTTDINNGNDLIRAINHLLTDDRVNKSEFYPLTQNDKVQMTLHVNNKTPIVLDLKVVGEGDSLTYSFEGTGIGLHYRALNFGEVLSSSFKETGESSVIIVKALGTLFSKEGFENLGGPIAIFEASKNAFQDGFGYFLRLWGVISVNLAVMNILPFPGLDGWHLLVVAFEGITRKEMPSKVKNIAATVGMVLLFGLMIVVLFKDIIKYII